MSSEEIRPSRVGDEAALKSLWKTVFCDEDEYIDSFFELLYSPGMARVCVTDGKIVSAAYILRLGELVTGGDLRPCSEIYALGTLPECRRRGIGRRVLSAAMRDIPGPTLVVPAEKELFDYYAPSGFAPYFKVSELTSADRDGDLEGSVTFATVRGYAALREELLHDTPHIDLGIPVLTFQERLCQMYGGGLCYVVSGRERCAAIVEKHENVAVIPELIVPSGNRRDAAELICRAFGVQSYSLRAPARPGEASRDFAMLSPAPLSDASPAWFGPAFD